MRRIRMRLAAALLLLPLTAAALLCGCRDASERDAVKIGVSVYKGDDTFISAMMESFLAAAAQFEQETGVRVNISVADAGESQKTQNEHIERVLSHDYDVLCVNSWTARRGQHHRPRAGRGRRSCFQPRARAGGHAQVG